MTGTQLSELRLAEADPARHAGYMSLRDRDERCNWCRMADRCPDAWEGAFECPDLDHLLKGEENEH